MYLPLNVPVALEQWKSLAGTEFSGAASLLELA